MRRQCKAVDLHIEHLNFSIGHVCAQWFVLFVCLQIGPKPLQLEFSPRIQAVVHLIQTCKFIEVIPNVKGLVIVPSIFVVNEFDISCGVETKYELVNEKRMGDVF